MKYYTGVPSPVKHPEQLNVVIFRENTEDVYIGIEWKQGTPEVKKLIDFLNNTMLAGTKKRIREDSGIGIKPISIFGTKRLVRMAIQHAIKNNRRSVTLVHKGNIQKFTEGAFREWGYEVARDEFRDHIVTERESWILDNKDKNPNLTVEAQRRHGRAGHGVCARKLPQRSLRGSKKRARFNRQVARQRRMEEEDHDQ